MFTGIVEAVGVIREMQSRQGDIRLTIATKALDMSDVKLGDSIAVNGICLTVVAFDAVSFSADASRETLSHTSLSQLGSGSAVNLEKAMLPTSRFGGHIVSGHVDGVATITRLSANARATDYWLKAPDELAHYIAQKGSITVDGISLTVNDVEGSEFRLTIIPHTAEKTTIDEWREGRMVNIEVDVVARYLERLLLGPKACEKQTSGVSMSLLANSGFLGPR
jgi:riboflavin synthase